MKGLEFLFDAMLEDVFTVQTAYASYPNLKFIGFEQENDDVTLAAFSSPDTLDTLYFDISIPSNQVININPNKKRESMKKVNVNELGNMFSIFGNKGNVWSNTAHAYLSGRGNLCGTPALSHNHAAASGIEEVGCPECLKQITISGYAQVPFNR